MTTAVTAQQLEYALLEHCDGDVTNQRYKNLKSSLKKLLDAHGLTLDNDISALFTGRGLFHAINETNRMLTDSKLSSKTINAQLSNIKTGLKDIFDELHVITNPIRTFKDRLKEVTSDAKVNNGRYFKPIADALKIQLGIENAYQKIISPNIGSSAFNRKTMPTVSDVPAFKIVEEMLGCTKNYLLRPLKAHLKQALFEKSRITQVVVDTEHSEYKKIVIRSKKLAGAVRVLRVKNKLSFDYYLDKVCGKGASDHLSSDLTAFILDFNNVKTSSSYKMIGHTLAQWKVVSSAPSIYINPLCQTFKGQAMRCPTANKTWVCLGSFYGYLGCPEEPDEKPLMSYKEKNYFTTDDMDYFKKRYSGKGLSPDGFNAGMLLDYDLVEDYVDKLFSCQLIPQADTFLRCVLSMLSIAENGNYFLLSSLAKEQAKKHLGFTEQELIDHMPKYIAYLKSKVNDVKVKGKAHKSRDVSEDLADILTLDSPLDFLLQTENNMDSDQTEKFTLASQFIFSRNKLLFKMIIDNPLRCYSLSCLTVPASSNSGTLRKKANGNYEYVFTSDHFKNLTETDKNLYRADFPENLNTLLEEYLALREKVLGTEDNPFLFISKNRVAVNMKVVGGSGSKSKNIGKGLSATAISDVLSNFSYKYAPFRTYKFKGHAFRHIVATGYLKDNPESYFVVAQLLHDKLETVIARYSHNQTDVGLKKHREHMASKRLTLQKAS
jgi:hypothetical protein